MKRLAPTLVYRKPTSMLQPQRLYAYLDAVWRRRDLEGAIVEVGCYVGGTAALASNMLRNTGFEKRYVCVDTFSGFVGQQFDVDARRGTSAEQRSEFAANSLSVVRRLMRHYGAERVELVQADVTTMAASSLPDRIAVSLIDVDLEVPTYEALRRIYPRLVPGGVILVDDCDPEGDWVGPRAGYERFVADHGLAEEYAMGMGMLRREAA